MEKSKKNTTQEQATQATQATEQATEQATQTTDIPSPVKKIDEEKRIVIISGILSQNIDKAGYKNKGEEKRNISIKMSRPLTEDERNKIAEICKADRNDKYCPHAINEKKEYFTVKTSFEVPCRCRTDRGFYEITLNEIGLGSTVRLACRLKDNAIYPLSMEVISLVEFDPFEFFN